MKYKGKWKLWEFWILVHLARWRFGRSEMWVGTCRISRDYLFGPLTLRLFTVD